ncbi:MAG TPA: hypothetical protein VIU61_17390 [Kofleriaceae bacterium]
MKRLALLAVLASATAHADERVYAVDFSSQVRWFGDTSAAIIADKPMGGPQITLSRHLLDVDAPLRRSLSVAAFGRFAFAGAQDQIFGALDTTLSQYMFTGGLRGDVPLRYRFSLVGQVELGMARTGLTIVEGQGTGAMSTPVDDHEWHAIGSVSAGTEFAIVDHRAFKLGLGFHVGYTLATPIELHAYPGDRPDDSITIPTMFAAIGDLDTRGVTFSGGLRGAF